MKNIAISDRKMGNYSLQVTKKKLCFPGKIGKNPPFTQEKLSELVEKNQNYIGLIEKGKSSPPLEMIALIAEKLDIEPSILLEKNATLENVSSLSREEFIANLSENIVENLRDTIAKEIQKSLK